jgi:hypothetical protein
MTEPKAKKDDKMVNELSTSAKSIFLTPDAGSRWKESRKDADEQESDSEAVKFYSPGPLQPRRSVHSEARLSGEQAAVQYARTYACFAFRPLQYQ